ncbi:MAG: prepilin-type N-terminal cleavage/methylation domain-containing protein [Eubacteriales bacterium]
MCKRATNTNHRRGFTLVELVLVMAIMMILVSVIYATFNIINTSHARVAVINDAKDFADLNMMAIENLATDAQAVKLSSNSSLVAGEENYTSIYFKADSSLNYFVDGTSEKLAFNYGQYTVNNGTQLKWAILQTQPIFTSPATGIVHVKLQIVDNSSGNVYYTLEKDIIMINITSPSGITGSSGTVIKIKNFTI